MRQIKQEIIDALQEQIDQSYPKIEARSHYFSRYMIVISGERYLIQELRSEGYTTYIECESVSDLIACTFQLVKSRTGLEAMAQLTNSINKFKEKNGL